MFTVCILNELSSVLVLVFSKFSFQLWGCTNIPRWCISHLIMLNMGADGVHRVQCQVWTLLHWG